MTDERRIESIPGVCDVERLGRSAGAPTLLIELPHGATRGSDFDALAARLISMLPDRLREFFFVNTDVGCHEAARLIAARLVDHFRDGPAVEVVIVRSLLPRTLVDCNRLLAASADDARRMTPAIPSYVDRREDRVMLADLYARYRRLVERAYEALDADRGWALQLHTYAPRSIQIDTIDGSIVETLREAYAPENYDRWRSRPSVELISEDPAGVMLAPARLVTAIKRHYRAAGIELAENETYRLHHDTTGYVDAARRPGRVCCVELNRGLLAEPFAPFEEMRVGAAKLERLAGPLASAYIEIIEEGAGA
ncbi:MAG TPA: hypothetical protein VD788_17815 [Candidatus Polarisedimenticolaceae bacterium]|nr:hypothetical protein [Candidatus Polarisedimenticolaceae bacterium]